MTTFVHRANLVRLFKHARQKDRLLARFAAEGVDTSVAEAEARKARTRWDENLKLFKFLKTRGLDRKKYGDGFQKLVDNGQEAVAAIKAVAHKYHGVERSLRGEPRRQLSATFGMLAYSVQHWEMWGPNDATNPSSENRLANTYAYAQQMESYLKALPDLLKGLEVVIDDSWRDH
jgi:hypothetical protein